MPPSAKPDAHRSPNHEPSQKALTLDLLAHAPGTEPVDITAFTEALSHMAASVWVVSAGAGADRRGRTVTSLMSLSIHPPSLVVSITSDSPLADTIVANGGFSLSLLAEGQQAVGDAFAGQVAPEQRFAAAGVWSHWMSGRPRLENAVVAMDCTLSGTVATGSHNLFVGTVTAVRTIDAPPLLWHRRNYRGLLPG